MIFETILDLKQGLLTVMFKKQFILFFLFYVLLLSFVVSKEWQANTSNYNQLVKKLSAGDVIKLSPGKYTSRFWLSNIKGTAEAPIIIMGQEGVLLGGDDKENTIDIMGCEYLVIKDLVLDGQKKKVDGIKFGKEPSHHVTLENITIKNYDSHQSSNGISSKVTCWDITIRNCVIENVGTGLYLGNSDGSEPFINGVIENNLVMQTIGYGMEIKHQVNRPSYAGIPQVGETHIRDNLFCKHTQAKGVSLGDRPNLLVGHFPKNGAGKDDCYQIYRNLFYENISGEYLFQGEGNIYFHHNILINTSGGGINIQPHNDKPKKIKIAFNTILAHKRGVFMDGGDTTHKQFLVANLIFSDGGVKSQHDENNLAKDYSSAKHYLVSPLSKMGELNVFPIKTNSIRVSTEILEGMSEINKDYFGLPTTLSMGGAIEKANGRGVEAGLLKIDRKNTKNIYGEMAGEDARLQKMAEHIASDANLSMVYDYLERESVKNDIALRMFTFFKEENEALLRKARETKTIDEEASLSIYDEVIRKFGYKHYGKLANEESKVFRSKVIAKKKERLIAEQKAEQIWKNIEIIESRLKEVNQAKDYQSEEFRRINASGIQMIKKYLNLIQEKYTTTSFSEKANLKWKEIEGK